MKKTLLSRVALSTMVFAMVLGTQSCSKDDGNVFDTPDTGQENEDDPEEEVDDVATLVFNEGDPSNDIFVADASGEAGGVVPGRVIFTSTATTQRRMYITQNIGGGGDMPFNNFNLDSDDLKKALKADGSIDLDGATKKEIDFTFNLPVPDIDNGEIVYSFWTTTGKGDFRDPTKRQALGVGTITVTVGNGNNPDAEVRHFTDIKLFAPAEDGRTESFFSFLDGSVYKIVDGNVDDEEKGAAFRAFWDFGYFYTNDDKASFASTAYYKTAFPFDVEGFEAEEGVEDEELNEMYFNLSAKTSTEFDAIVLAEDLETIEKSTFPEFNSMNAGDVIEFVDNYGKKGLIKITAVEPGYDNNDYIMFDVKIQP